MTPSRPPTALDGRAEAVFDAFFTGGNADLHPADRDEAAAFWEWLGERQPPVAARPSPGNGWRRVGIAAAILASVGGSIAWLHRPAPATVFTASYQTVAAERRVLHLADGSAVTLAADSRVELGFTPGERRLRLVRGEALFQVAHDRSRPFVVATPHGEVKAVGTAFDVALERREAKVTVVEGTIRIALPGGRGSEPIVKLATRGERVAFGMAERGGGSVGFISQSTPASIDAAIAWTHGQLAFQGEPLEEVIATVNRYVPDPAARLSLRDRRAARLPVYGIVDQGDPAAIRDLVTDPSAVAIHHAKPAQPQTP